MDKLRACIVANYYASAGLLKAGEVRTTLGKLGNICEGRCVVRWLFG